jgi:hypothetical protein
MGEHAHLLHYTWRSMINRCENPNHKAWKHYGGRGITVCRRWRKLDNFIADMGPRPQGMTLDRYPDNDGDYKPSNCRWATRSQQSRNRRNNRLLTFNGQTMTMWDWAEKVGMTDSMQLFRRLKNGWTVLAAR